MDSCSHLQLCQLYLDTFYLDLSLLSNLSNALEAVFKYALLIFSSQEMLSVRAPHLNWAMVLPCVPWWPHPCLPGPMERSSASWARPDLTSLDQENTLRWPDCVKLALRDFYETVNSTFVIAVTWTGSDWEQSGSGRVGQFRKQTGDKLSGTNSWKLCLSHTISDSN